MPPPGRLLLAASSLTIFWERLWRRLWPAACIAGMFIALSLMDILPGFPGWLHGLILLVFVALTGYALHYAMDGLALVDGLAARRRIEKDSGLDHHPLTALEDKLAAGSETLWNLHLARMAEKVRTLHLRGPAPDLAKYDPYGFRAAVILFLVVGVLAAGGEAPQRLMRALSPNLFSDASPPMVEAWITPPAYTGQSRIYLDGSIHKVPEGSALLVQANGAKAAPTLKLGKKVMGFTALGRDAFKAESILEKGGQVSVNYHGREIATWAVDLLADAPPSVTVLNDPAESKGRLLRLEYEAKDDYGVTELAAIIQLSGASSTPQNDLRVPLPFSGKAKTTVKGSALKDLTAHPWAGLPVSLSLEATDAHGGKGESAAIYLFLPERIFNHPVAKEIIAARKKLANPTLESYVQAAMDINDITANPERFSNDSVVYLALRVAQARLDYDREGKAHKSVREILWNTALRLEDGGLSIAENNLRTAREQLMQALRKGEDSKKIKDLMNQLQHALETYLGAMMEKMKALGAPPQFLSSSMDVLKGVELQEMINQAREMAKVGNMDGARQMLSKLSQILDNFQGNFNSGAMNKEMAQANDLLDEARRLADAQQKIVDETFERMRKDTEKRNRAGRHLKPDMGDGGRRQEALRKDLNSLMEKFSEMVGGVPRSLGAAELDMRAAKDAIGAEQDKAALSAQSRALDNLRQGVKEMGQKLAERFGKMGSKMMMGREKGRDPFGRRQGGGSMGGTLDLPTRRDAREAGRILKELRRRAGQRHRSEEELDYIKRLLKLF